MAFIIQVYKDNKIYNIDLSLGEISSIGSSKKDTLMLDVAGIKRKHIVFKKIQDGFLVKSKGQLMFGNTLISSNQISVGDRYLLSINNSKITIVVYPKQSDSDAVIDLMDIRELTFGRSQLNDIVLNNMRTSSKHCKIYKSGNDFRISDCGSRNGTYLNGKKIRDEMINNNDIINISIYSIVFIDGKLTFKNTGSDMMINLENSSRQIRASKEYPYFQRSPRLVSEILPSEFEINPPPSKGQKPQINWLSVLLPPVVMIGVMIGVSRVNGGNMMSLMYTIPMMLVGVIVAVLNYISQKRKHKKMDLLRNKKYFEYLKDVENDLKVKLELQRNTLNEIHPSFEECLNIVFNIERRLWDRMPSDNDFMSLRLGKGERPFNVGVRIPKRGIELVEDNLLKEPERIQRKFKIVKDVSISVSMLNSCTVGVVGERSSIIKVVHNLIVQATTHHSYDEVKIVTLFSQEEELYWEWIKWLPHSWDDGKNTRYIANNKTNASKLLKEFEEILKERKKLMEEDRDDNNYCLPYILFIISDKNLIEGQTILKRLTDNDKKLGIGTLFLYDTMSNLPKNCKVIIDCKSKKGEIFARDNAINKVSFVFDDIDLASLDKFARNLAPIKVKMDAVDSKLPSCITFLQGYGVKNSNEIDLAKNWSSGLTYKSMAVPIGVKSNGDTFYFDIWEKAHGPFGQVAGMPGSGKSEMVQTWILSMALNFSPSDVSFVLIDFKGTGLILPFVNMPHLAGTISDIDTNIHRNLIALENELKRRKELFNSQGVQNITDYLKLLKSGAATEPLSIMIIIVDEFAEMKMQFPDFMPVIDSLFAIGRSLGVYCILMSQKPTGVVSGKVEANTKFRWCLRVASAAESKEMIGHSEASKITVPGRGYIKVGDDEIFEHIQSYWSGAPYDPNKVTHTNISHHISTVDLDGTRIRYKTKEKVVGSSSNTTENEIDALVNHISNYTKSNKIAPARKVWMPKLLGEIYLNKISRNIFDGERWINTEQKISIDVGMVDNPYTQSQYPLCFNLTDDGHHVVFGAPGSGKTTMLQTVVMSLIYKYSPEEVNIYIMDFGGWSMGIFKDFPHVGGIANDNDAERVEKTVRLLTKELESRRQKFSDQSVGNIVSYKSATNEKLPSIVLVLDNFEPVKNIYPELESFFINLTREGGNYGIYLVACGNNVSSLWYKMSTNIKATIALQMTDKSDYPSIVGKTNGLEPEKLVGRGLFKSSPSALEFQAALPVDGTTEVERVNKIKELSKIMSTKWLGKKAKPIPIMPDVIRFGTIDANDIAIGLTSSDVDSLDISFENNHYILISGKSSSGKSNLVKVIAKQFSGKIVAFDSTNSSLKSISANCSEFLIDVLKFDEFIANIVPTLQKRKEELTEDNSKKFDPYLIIIDDLKQCFDLISDNTAKILYQIIRLGKGLNVNLLVAGNCDEISKMYNQGETFTIGLVNGPISILIGGNFKAHGVFKVNNLSYSDQDIQLDEFEAYILNKEKATRFKTMYEME